MSRWGTDRMVGRTNKKEGRAAKLDEFRRVCRQKGLKVTPQRMAVYLFLIGTDEHPSAERVFQQVRRTYPNISLDTVNRTLLTLSDAGMAFAVEGSGDARRFDGNTESHQHFKCVRCRRIIDFHYEPFGRIGVPESIADQFTVLRATVYVEGLCDRCRDDSRRE
jgi:Fur family transcriptional regulator, peroxide stress response regulator